MNANKTYFNGANAIVFDTETTNLDKPFCYNVGYKIIDSNGNTIVEHDFVVEQIWHNMPLFSTAYYANKRPLYVGRMRSRQTILDKWGYIMATMRREIKAHNVRYAYAYNAPFDDKVFGYNCDYYKTLNPLDTVEVIESAFCSNLEIDVDCEDSCPVMLLIFVVFEVTFDSMPFAFCVNVATLLVIVVNELSTSVFFSVHSVTFAPSSILGFVIVTFQLVTPLWSLFFGNWK